MTGSAATDSAAIAELERRLDQGVLPSVRDDRISARPDQGMQDHDRRALAATDLQTCFTTLYTVRSSSPPGAADVATALNDLTHGFAADRALLIAILMSPRTVLDNLRDLIGRTPEDLADRWLGLCWIAEAAWAATTTSPVLPSATPIQPQEQGGTNESPARRVPARPTTPRVSAEDRRLLRPLAARLRFLVLSEPFRHRDPGKTRTTPWAAMATGGAQRVKVLERVYGTDSWNTLVDHCREARSAWSACLNTYQSHPYLSVAPADALEAELRELVFTRGRKTPPLVLTGHRLDKPAPLGAGDATLISDVIERHLLPRFDVRSVAALAWYAPGDAASGRAVTWRRIHAALVVIGAVATGLVVFFGGLWWATGAAGATFALLGAGVVGYGGPWTALWMLRLPAAGSVGLLVLLTLPEHWWQQLRFGWDIATLAPLVLTVAAFGYLMLEARNHGIARAKVLVRAAAITVIGATHALLVTLIGLVAVAPAFTAQGRALGRLLAHPTCNRHLLILALATSWCLAVGVFSQILWDDRPITAPLAHTDWRTTS